MAILGFNRRLLWVIVPAVLWAVIGLSLAVGASRGGDHPPLRLVVGPPAGGFWLKGEVRSIVEEPDCLRLTLELPPGEGPEIRGPGGESGAKLPPDIQLQVVAPGDLPPGPPEVRTLDGEQWPRKLPGDRLLTVTKRYVVRHGKGRARIVARPPELSGERLKDWLRRWLQREDEPQKPNPPAVPEQRGEPRRKTPPGS